MLREEERKDYGDFKDQVDIIKGKETIDRDGDGQVHIDQLANIMALLGEPKCPPEKLEAIREKISDYYGEGWSGKIDLDQFFIIVREYLDSYGSKKEVE